MFKTGKAEMFTPRPPGHHSAWPWVCSAPQYSGGTLSEGRRRPLSAGLVLRGPATVQFRGLPTTLFTGFC